MYHPNLGRWMTLDPVEYQAGDVNLFRSEGNQPISTLDPTGLVGLDWEAVLKLLKGFRYDSGEGKPPPIRDFKVPGTTVGVKEYGYAPGNGDPVYFGKGANSEITVRFSQETEFRGSKVKEDIAIKAWGWRVFESAKNINDSGDHVPYFAVQITFVNRKCGDEKLPDRWEQFGFYGNYGVFLRTVKPAVNELVSLKMVKKNDDTYHSYLYRWTTGVLNTTKDSK